MLPEGKNKITTFLKFSTFNIFLEMNVVNYFNHLTNITIITSMVQNLHSTLRFHEFFFVTCSISAWDCCDFRLPEVDDGGYCACFCICWNICWY